jgi:hypothetical protein
MEVLQSSKGDELLMRGYRVQTSTECTTIIIVELTVMRCLGSSLNYNGIRWFWFWYWFALEYWFEFVGQSFCPLWGKNPCPLWGNNPCPLCGNNPCPMWGNNPCPLWATIVVLCGTHHTLWLPFCLIGWFGLWVDFGLSTGGNIGQGCVATIWVMWFVWQPSIPSALMN